MPIKPKNIHAMAKKNSYKENDNEKKIPTIPITFLMVRPKFYNFFLSLVATR